MPLDPSIILAARPQPIDIGDTLKTVAQLRQFATQQQASEQQIALSKATLEDRQRGIDDAKAVDSASMGAPDVQTIVQRLKDSGRGHQVPSVLKQFEEADAAATKAKEARIALEQAEAEYTGSLARGVAAHLSDPDGGMGAAQIAFQHAAAQGHDVKDLWTQVQANPQALPQIVTSLIAQSKTASELTRQEAVAAETARHNTAGEATTAADKLSEAQNRTTDNLRLDQQAAELARHNRAMENRPTAAQLKPPPEAVDVSPDIKTTIAGRSYLDLSNYTTAERARAREAASQAGAVIVSKDQADALQEIDNARLNQRSILGQISGILPKDPTGRILAAPGTKLAQVFQTEDHKSAFNSWRTAAIQALRATAGSKGLRINQAEIAQAIENDIPTLNDTLGTAQQKVKNIETMLENAEQSILVRDRSATTSTTDPAASAAKKLGLPQ